MIKLKALAVSAAILLTACSPTTTLVENSDVPYESKWETPTTTTVEFLECPSRPGQYYKVGHEILCLEEEPKAEPKEPEVEEPICKTYRPKENDC